ncbi:response regulator [Zavarzinia sp. CC-PAN008]|uniref:response regulator n=1 Tax=Zavarzinia sp. CC-PAN008 TaxID=3243332 RepID=UPI003F746012
MSGSLLAVDNDEQIARLIASVGRAAGLDAEYLCRSNLFPAAYRRIRPSIITLEMVMRDLEGIEIIQWLARQGATARIVIISGADINYSRAAKLLGEAMGLSSITIMPKPLSLADLRQQLEEQERAFRPLPGTRPQPCCAIQ